MKYMNMMRKYYQEAGSEGADGGGAGDVGDAGGTGGTGGTGGGESLGGPSDWMSSLNDDHKAHLAKNGISDIQGLIDNHVNLQGHVGSSIRVPSEDASDEAKADFIAKLTKHAPDLIPRPKAGEDNTMLFTALGRPDDAAGYGEVNVPDELKSFVGEERIQALQQAAHKSNLTKDQFNAVVGEVLAMDAMSVKASMDSVNQGRDAVKSEWGAAYDERHTKALNVLAATGAPQAVQDAFKNGMATGDAIKWAYELSTRLGGGDAGAVHDQGGGGTLTPQEASLQIGEIMDNPKHAYWDAGHPEHQAAIKRVTDLGRLADPKNANRVIRGAMTYES